MENLQKAGVVGADFEQAVGEVDASTVGGAVVENSGNRRGSDWRRKRRGLCDGKRGLRRLSAARSGAAAKETVISVLGTERCGRKYKRDGSEDEGGVEAAHLKGGTCVASGR